jgi:hypothetical protein
LRLVRISEPYVNVNVVQKPRRHGTPLYALGVSNLYELGKAISANVMVIHIYHDCTSLIQEQRRRQRELKIRRNIEWVTITVVFSSIVVSHWMRNQRFLGGEHSGSLMSSFLNDFSAQVRLFLTSSPSIRSSSQVNSDAAQPLQLRLSPAAIIALEGSNQNQTQSASDSQCNSSCCWVSSVSSIWKSKTTLFLTTTIIASITFWLRSRRDYVLLKVAPTDDGPCQTEHFLIRQDAVRLKQTLAQRALANLPLCIAAIASSMLIRRSLVLCNK